MDENHDLRETNRRLGLESDSYLDLPDDGSLATLDGAFNAADLRKIADELDRLAQEAE